MIAVLKYHYGFSLEEIYNLSISQFSGYVDNLGFVLGQEKEDDKIYDPKRDASDPNIRAEFENALGIRKNG